MANTYTDYTAAYNETSFSYGFTVLLAAHVAVEINGVAKTYNTDYTVDKTTSVVTLQLGGIVGTGATAGDIVRIRRSSDPSNDLVDFADGSRLSASRLDLAYQHNRFLNEEASEISDGAIGETTIAGVAFLDATAREIRNISAPTTNTSAVTKQYVDDQQALSGTNMTAFGADNYTGDGTTLAFNFYNISPQITDSKAFLVNIDGITQNPSSFTITTTGITFQTAPVTSSKISVLTLAGAAITAPVDGVTTELKTGNKIGVKNGGISNIHLEGNIAANKLAGGILGSQLATNALALAYPVGSIYMNASNTSNPSTLLGFGSWTAFGAGKVPVGIDASQTEFDTLGETGGAKTHTLAKTEIPPHQHVYNMKANITGGSTDGGDGYNLGFSTYNTNQGDIGENSNGTGNASPHNNLQPYVVVHMWKRIG